MNEATQLTIFIPDCSDKLIGKLVDYFSKSCGNPEINRLVVPYFAFTGLVEYSSIKPNDYWQKYHNATLVSPGKIKFVTETDKLEFFLTFG